MANLKISQMPAATTLTGAELIEMIQGGAEAKEAVSSLGAIIASPPLIGGGSTAQSGTITANVTWLTLWPFTSGAPYGTSNLQITNGYPVNATWQAGGTPSLQAFNGAGANFASSCQMGIVTSVSTAGNGAFIALVGGIGGITGTQRIPMVRGLANGFPVTGLTMTAYFALGSTLNVSQLFFGFYGQGSPAIAGANVPSALLNSIGLGRDTADTNLQFMINNAAGSAQKTDLGVTHTSLAGHLLRLVITCDGFGNVTITLTDLESGGATYTASFATTTAKLPILQSGSGSLMAPLFYVNNGGAAGAVSFKYLNAFITMGPGT